MNNRPYPKVMYGAVLAIIGLFLTIIILLTLGNNPTFQPVITLYASLGLGVYFLGLGIVANGLISQYDNTFLIKQISDAINSSGKPMAPTLIHESSEPETPTAILSEIRDILKESGGENRELTYAMFILSWVVAIATLLMVGNEIWKSYGWSLPVLWIASPFLMFGGMWYFYCAWKKISLGWNITVLSIISIIGIVLIISANGTHLPQSAQGNITNIYENGSYPMTNIVNNYNVTIAGGYDGNKKSDISIEELKGLMQKRKQYCY